MQNSSEKGIAPAKLVMRLYHATRRTILECKQVLEELPPLEQERYVVFHECHRTFFLHDPLETDPAMDAIFEEVHNLVKLELAAWEREREEKNSGMISAIQHRCMSLHVGWQIKKRLLKERYGLDWRTLEEMNKGIHID